MGEKSKPISLNNQLWLEYFLGEDGNIPRSDVFYLNPFVSGAFADQWKATMVK